jgi:hypothetical protein
MLKRAAPAMAHTHARTGTRRYVHQSSGGWHPAPPGGVAARLLMARPVDRRALLLALVASLYIAFAVAGGRPNVMAVAGGAIWLIDVAGVRTCDTE